MTARNAILAVALLGCSGDHYHGVDARPQDAAIDALGTSIGNPPPEAVVLTVTSLGAAAANVPVYFQNPDGALVKSETTDERGLAWAIVEDGASVTAIEPANASGAVALTTFTSVQSSDRLHLDLAPFGTTASVTLTVRVPAGGASYQLYNSCGDPVGLDGSGAGSVTFLDCGGGTIDIVAVELDANGDRQAALYAPGVAIADGGDVMLPGGFQAFAATTFHYTNVPSDVTWMSTYQAILTSRGRVFDATDGAAPAAGVASTAVAEPQTPAGTLALTVSDAFPDSTAAGEQLVYEWSPWTATYDLDVTAKRLPEYATPPTYDVATHAIAWTEQPGQLIPSFVRARLHAYRDDIPVGHAWTWRIVGPPIGTTMTFPHVPNDGFDFNLATGDTVGIDELTSALVPGGYDAFRAHGFSAITSAITGTTGTIIVEVPYTPSL